MGTEPGILLPPTRPFKQLNGLQSWIQLRSNLLFLFYLRISTFFIVKKEIVFSMTTLRDYTYVCIYV